MEGPDDRENMGCDWVPWPGAEEGRLHFPLISTHLPVDGRLARRFPETKRQDACEEMYVIGVRLPCVLPCVLPVSSGPAGGHVIRKGRFPGTHHIGTVGLFL